MCERSHDAPLTSRSAPHERGQRHAQTALFQALCAHCSKSVRRKKLGEIYRSDAAPSHDTEHRVLSERYVYPSERNSITTVIRPSGRRYDGFADFAARVAWSDGSRYVESVCDDGATLPGGRVAR